MAYIETLRNVFNNSRVSGDARVSGNAFVSDNAFVSGDARVSGDADILTMEPAISSGRHTTAHTDSVIGVRVNTGCFSGSIQEFIDAIESTHKGNAVALRQYRSFVAAIKAHFGL